MEVKLPDAFRDIFNPYRYKVFYGGRGSAKSQSIARYLLIAGAAEPMRILCCREFQTSIKDSVHQLLADLIEEMGLASFYTVLNTEIRGKNGTQFIFAGLRHNIANIKSMHDVKKCWVEEAQVVSEASWNVLIPTIRADNSEILLSLNPELEDDPTYQKFIVHRPPNSLVVKVNYDQNPFFNDVLRAEMEHLKAIDHKAYLNVWEGQCKAAVEGAIFADVVQKAAEEGRITRVPYDKTKPVDVFYDLGRNDKTAMWFVQYIGYEYRLIRYYENSGQHFSHFIKYMRELPYAYGRHYPPHDATAEHISAEKTIQKQLIDAFGPNSSVPIPRIPKKALAIDAARGIFDRCVFDAELCADGLNCLRRYAYKKDLETGKTSSEPEHDTPWSHGADAFMAIGQSTLLTKKPDPPRRQRQLPSWAGTVGLR